MAHRIHIFGASGSGTSTLGAHLAQVIGGLHLATDSYYWHQTDPPFTQKRNPAERVSMIERERERYGSRILPGGEMHAQHLEFMEWAGSYDYARAPIRSFDLHERWMLDLGCPIIRLDSDRPVEELSDEVLQRAAV